MAITKTKEVEKVLDFDVMDAKNEIVAKYKGSPEVDRLTTLIVVDDPTSITSFGADVAELISKASDEIINSMSMTQVNDTGKMFAALSKIMDEFDIDELREEPKGVKKLFSNLTKQVEKILGKYDTMGKEIEKIYVQLKEYENEIDVSNQRLSNMFDASRSTYGSLEMHILAGEQGSEEIKQLIADTKDEFERQTYQRALNLLDARVNDLRMVEQIAMQSIPMLNDMRMNNHDLVRKIESAFIITLPVFKNAIAQAILLKRQRIQAQATAALDEKTNELLRKNAENYAKNSTEIARLTSQSSIKIETVEETYNTIVNGIKETRRIQEEAVKKNAENKVRLEKLKVDFKNVVGLPDKQ